jgi:putative tryptophan/tyrosine transport system substrate-binding protein
MLFDRLRRREFITLFGGAAAWPVTARAQQQGKVARIGFLGASTASSFALTKRGEAFRSGLRDLGYVDGANVTVEYRWADDKYERLPALAAELVRSNVDVIVTQGTPASLAAKRATTTIPIVMATIGDPVAAGVVASLARPCGNITGQSFFAPQLDAKRIELLKELMPRMTRAAVLSNPDNPGNGLDFKTMDMTAHSLNVELLQFPVRAPSEFKSAFERMVQEQIAAVEIGDDSMFLSNLGAIVELATQRRLVSVGSKELVQAGGLMGYGVDLVATYRRTAIFVDRILKGAKPADIPVEQATKFEFVLNLKTAKALDLNVPPIMLVRADEVIE